MSVLLHLNADRYNTVKLFAFAVLSTSYMEKSSGKQGGICWIKTEQFKTTGENWFNFSFLF